MWKKMAIVRIPEQQQPQYPKKTPNAQEVPFHLSSSIFLWLDKAKKHIHWWVSVCFFTDLFIAFNQYEPTAFSSEKLYKFYYRAVVAFDSMQRETLSDVCLLSFVLLRQQQKGNKTYGMKPMQSKRIGTVDVRSETYFTGVGGHYAPPYMLIMFAYKLY